MYLMKHGGQKGKPAAYNTVYTAFSPLFAFARKNHQQYGIKDRFLPELRNLLKSYSNERGKSSRQMKTFTDEDLMAIFTMLNSKIEYANASGKIGEANTFIRSRAMFSLNLAGCLRANELLNLNCNDISFHQKHMVIQIRKSKTGTVNHSVTIFKNQDYGDRETQNCPVIYLQEYLKSAKLNTSLKGPLFRKIDRKDNTKFIRSGLHVNTWRLIIRRICRDVGLLPVEDYGTHSLRRTSATNIIRNGGSSLALKRHGNWKSHAFERYVEEGSTIKEKTSLKTFSLKKT